MTMNLKLAAQVMAASPAASVMLQSARAHAPREQMIELVDRCRRNTGDEITHLVALVFVMHHVHQMGELPHASGFGFRITDRAGNAVDPADVPAPALAWARMVTAVCNGDLDAAVDVFKAYAATYPDRVSESLVEWARQVAASKPCGCEGP